MRILITGGTGAVGPAIVMSLRRAGHDVLVLALDAPKAGILPDDVELRFGDVTDPGSVASAIKDMDGVVHLASLLHINEPEASLRREFERINVGGTAVVVEAAAKADVRRLVFASTIAVYGPSGGEVLDEESSTRPDTIYARSKLSAENIVLAARRGDGQPLGTVLRFSAVYGAGIKGNYFRLVRAMSKGRFVPLGRGSNRRTLIYNNDLAEAVMLTMSCCGAAGQIFNVSDCKLHRMREIVAAISLAMGKRAPGFSLPIKPIRWASGLLEDSAKIVGCASPITRATIDKYTEDIAVSGDKICRALGFVPKYDLASGWRETVENMRKMGEL